MADMTPGNAEVLTAEDAKVVGMNWAAPRGMSPAEAVRIQRAVWALAEGQTVCVAAQPVAWALYCKDSLQGVTVEPPDLRDGWHPDWRKVPLYASSTTVAPPPGIKTARGTAEAVALGIDPSGPTYAASAPPPPAQRDGVAEQNARHARLEAVYRVLHDNDFLTAVQAKRAARAILVELSLLDAALSVQGAAPPPGWKLVPTSPSVAMIRAGHSAYTDLCEFSSDVPSRVYGAMLAASPAQGAATAPARSGASTLVADRSLPSLSVKTSEPK